MHGETLDSWRGLLGAIKPLAPEAHIAGGAVRDLLNGKDIKDIDVFIGSNGPLVAQAVLDLGYVLDRVVGAEYFTFDSRVKSAAIYFKPGDPTPLLNIIEMTTPITMYVNIARFDFGLCCAGFDGDTLYTTQQYSEDVANAQFTLVTCENYDRYDQSMLRYERLSQKYELYPLVVPEKFKQYAPEYRPVADVEYIF